MSVSPEEHQRVFEHLWTLENGFRFLHECFGDLTSSPAANEEACKFLRAKIKSIVKDPAKATALTPWDLFARRPPYDQGYYEKFNQDNVFAIDLRETPILRIEEKGIKTVDGKLHELDVLVLATSFQSGDGSYKSIQDDIRGRRGMILNDHWARGIKTYLGIFVSTFPNLFMVNGPQASFSHAPRTMESEAEWVSTCDHLAVSRTLVKKVNSWLTGLNVAGARPSTLFYYAGLKAYRSVLQDAKKAGYRGLVTS